MQLPFTKEQFFDLFVAYNAGVWPALLALWIASLVVSVLLLSSRRPPDRWISALLAVHWAWSALAYHAAFFTSVNPAAWVFAALFLVQAALFFRVGVVQGRLSFAPWSNAWAPVAWGLVAYSLVYPAINAGLHRSVSRIPTFGVPCPTTIFTAGLLMMLAAPRSWRLSIVPVIWSLIGGSAAFVLGVRADYGLPVAGIALAIFSTRRSSGRRGITTRAELTLDRDTQEQGRGMSTPRGDPTRGRDDVNGLARMRVARQLSTVLLAVMLTQALMGLAFQSAYRDVEWIKASWFGNDWATLVVAAPLLLIGLVRTAAGSVRGLLLWLGLVGYALYNYAFYLFGAALNAFFPIYVVAVVLAASVLILALPRIDTTRLAHRVRPTAPVRLLGASLVCIAAGLASAWLAMWAAYVFAGRPTPVEPDAFRLVAALDLSLMVPALAIGGVLLWRRRPWGYVIASIASIQAALYLLVLSLNSVVAIQRGLVDAPGELPVWGALALLMTTVAVLLLANVPQPRSAASSAPHIMAT